MDFEALRARLGWNEQRQAQLDSLGEPALLAARVSGEDRGRYQLLGCEVGAARLAGRWRFEGALVPAVGDWVAVQPEQEVGVIRHVLPRTSLLERKRPGAEEAQVVAANVDLVLVVVSAEREPNLRRIERTLAVVAAGGARAVVLLNKSDLATDPSRGVEEVRSVSADITCLATSVTQGTGITEVRAFLGPGVTAALLGPSGAGKSSLINALLGDQRLATGAVRAADGKGRHTTTRRQLIELPEGGALVDTPGMRELGLWDAGEGIERAFSDVTALAAACRFRDCQHRGEPGCAIVAALDAGQLDARRFASFDKLRRENDFQERQHDPRVATAIKGRWKTIHKQQRARRLVDPKLRQK
jgi:ribosome biogenesis GTPase